ncbi:MAG: hypothetical protein ACR2H3_08160 [Acidimicrobiales bacterium]
MPGWLVPIMIVGAMAVMVSVLWLSAWVETSVLSPRSMIVSAAKARHTTPEYSEALVVREFERLLRDTQRS